jgi:hypothetical protein
MKGAACGFTLALLVSCGETSTGSAEASADPSDLPKKFTVLMETAQDEVRGLKEDLEKKSGPGAVRGRLAAIRKSIASARTLPHPKHAKKQAALGAAFDLFLGGVLQELEETTWDEKTGTALWKKLQAGCAACHQQYRD